MAFREPTTIASWNARPETREVPLKPIWHGYLLTREERTSLDRMMGKALLDSRFCDRLLRQRDSALLAEFGFSPSAEAWLCSIKADSLSELAQAAVCA